MKKPSISVFFPAYNDEGTIPSMVLKSIMVLEELTDDYEIIVIDDCSKDNTAIIADELVKRFKHVRVVHHEKNMGYGGALRSGFKSATKELVFYTDGDAQYDVFELKKLVPLMTDDVDVVNGFKIKRADPLNRIILGKMYQYGTKFLFGLKIKDVDCDFRLIRRKVFDKIELKSDSGIICVEMVKKIQNAGFKFKEISVSHYFRRHGKSQFFGFRRVTGVFIGLAGLWYELVFKRSKVKNVKKDN